KVDVIRDRAALARIVEDGRIENTFRLHLMNAQERPHRYRVTVEGLPGLTIAGPAEFDVEPASNRAVAVRVQAPPQAGPAGSNRIRFTIEAVDSESISRTEAAAFIIPR
ncbi:MAG TPA: FixG Ig-like domain-containing protein, partial [Burkholderiaceae bacterium]|nr:FixG Ig-like domain-containing protein [Burkholderiaceae bacterium]